MTHSFYWRGLLLPWLLAVACQPTSAPPQNPPPAPEAIQASLAPAPDLNQVSDRNDIRPTSKGQRLEFGELTGEFIVPAESTPLLVWQSPSGLTWLTGAPALAASVSEEQLRQFKARIDNSELTLQIESIQREANGDSRIHYRLSTVPAHDYTQLLEFYSPGESITLKGVVAEVKANTLNPQNDPIDLETTAALEVIAQDETLSLEQLKPEDVRAFSKKPELRDFIKFLKQELQRGENRQRKFTEITQQFNLREQVLPRVKLGLKELKETGHRRCLADPERCRQRLLTCRPTLLRRCKPLDFLIGTRSLHR
jgi:hypothetical protein